MKFQALTNHVLRDHVLIGGLAAACLAPFWGPWESLAFWIATVMVDADHYLHYLSCTKGRHFGIGPMLRFHEELFSRRHRPELLVLEIFHTVEFVLLLGWAAFNYFQGLIPVFWGVVFHMAVDFIHLKRYGILSKRVNSFLEYEWRKKGLLKQGLDPSRLMEETLNAANLR